MMLKDRFTATLHKYYPMALNIPTVVGDLELDVVADKNEAQAAADNTAFEVEMVKGIDKGPQGDCGRIA